MKLSAAKLQSWIFALGAALVVAFCLWPMLRDQDVDGRPLGDTRPWTDCPACGGEARAVDNSGAFKCGKCRHVFTPQNELRYGEVPEMHAAAAGGR
jgi:hypothetical protein